MQNNIYLQRILAIVCSVFDAYSAVLFLNQGQEGHYKANSWFSLGDRVDPECVVISGKGIVGSIAANQQPLLINNFDRKRGRLEYYGHEGEPNIKAFMGCMLKDNAGVLCLDSKRTFSFSEKDQKILHLFADLINDIRLRLVAAGRHENESGYYHSLQLIQGLRKRLTRWDAFLENFLLLVAETTGFDYCFLAARDDNGKNYYLEGANRPLFSGNPTEMQFAVGTGLVGWVFKNNAPVFLGVHESAGSVSPLFGKTVHTPMFQSLMCLPLHFSRATRGVLGFAHEDGIEISEHVKSFAQMAGGHLELFLENLFLKSKLRDLKKASP